jgi:uncharacterized membrane protein YhaH (DUF805 family)
MLHSERLTRSFNTNIRVFVASCLALILLLFFALPTNALAHTVTGGPSLQVSAGFETHYRDGNWVPVQITLHNDGPDFSGTLSLTASNPQYILQNDPSTSLSYQFAITLANGARKQVTMYLPLYSGMQNVTVKLLDSNGNAVGTQTASLNPLSPGDVFVGVLSDQSTGFGPLSTAPLPNQSGSVIVEFLNASTMPGMADILKNFNVIVLDDFTTSNLSQAQLAALQTWVNRGGNLIVSGGPEWRRTISALPAGLRPVAVNGTSTIPAGTSLLPFGAPRVGRLGQNTVLDSVRSPVTVSTASLVDPRKSEVVLSSGATPLIVQGRLGQGTVSYLAFDPTLEPLLGWQGASVFWEGLLLRGLGDQLLANSSIFPGTGPYNTQGQQLLASRMNGLLQSFLPNTLPSPWTLAILLIGYILVLGPVRLLLVRRLKRRDWSWRIVLSSVVIFSFMTYGIALEEKGTSVLSNSITVAQLGQSGSATHITTYLGVFVPSQGNFQIHIPDSSLVQPSADNLAFYQGGSVSSSGQSTTSIASVQNGTDVNLRDASIWTLHTIVSEQDRQLHQGLASHLSLQNGVLVGTVTNTLSYALSDAYLLMPNNALRLGHLAAGQTKQIVLKLSNAPLNPGQTLADLIVQMSGSAYPYGPYPYGTGNGVQAQTEWQRHLSILLTLDGKGYYGFPCPGPCPIAATNQQASQAQGLIGALGAIGGNVTSSGSVGYSTNINLVPLLPFSGGPLAVDNNHDALLVPGSPVTLIGWANSSLDSTNAVTINDISPTGLHETLVQAPLSVDLAGALNLPPSFIPSQLIDVEGSGIQVQIPGSYAMTTGSMTFEFAVPNIASLQISGLTISVSSGANQSASGIVTSSPNILPFHLYNWHSGSWNAISLNQGNFTTHNVSAYIGPGGRVLLQLVNKDNSLGTLVFGNPTLNLQGVVSNS